MLSILRTTHYELLKSVLLDDVLGRSWGFSYKRCIGVRNCPFDRDLGRRGCFEAAESLLHFSSPFEDNVEVPPEVVDLLDARHQVDHFLSVARNARHIVEF